MLIWVVQLGFLIFVSNTKSVKFKWLKIILKNILKLFLILFTPNVSSVQEIDWKQIWKASHHTAARNITT